MTKENNLPTDQEITNFEMLEELIGSIYVEMKQFSKKKPNEALNEFKVKNVNRVLKQLKEFLKDEPTSDYLDLLDNETLPTNSDAILIIGQYKASMQSYKKKFTNEYSRWTTQENPTGERR